MFNNVKILYFRVNNTIIMGRRSGPGSSARTRDAQPLPLNIQHNSSTTNDRSGVSQHDELINFVGDCKYIHLIGIPKYVNFIKLLGTYMLLFDIIPYNT